MDIRNNYKKAEEQFEKGYISGCTTSIQKPCSSSQKKYGAKVPPTTRRLYDGCTSRNRRGYTQ